MAPSISVPIASFAHNARNASGATVRPSISTPCRELPSSRPDTLIWCRWSPNSSRLRTGRKSRIAKTAPPIAGLPSPTRLRAGRLVAHGHQYAQLKPIWLGDDLFARQPLCEAVQAGHGNFLFVCKPATHTLIQEYITGVTLESYTECLNHGRTWVTHRYRWITGVPLRDTKDALAVNWLEVEIVDAAGKVTYRNSFITDLPVTRENVAEFAACDRARWKIENETFNVLKTRGYNLEHGFGHRKQNLAALIVVLNLLAFAFHTVCDLAENARRLARAKAGSRSPFFGRLATITES
jgi:hypothetical protein